jgi:branched-subunit amino acid aminotransferase/4-amino-4-deoxychorismate lyase
MNGSEAIAWIGDPGGDGSWGAPAELAIPLNDRGLQLADGLFETLLVEEGVPLLLERHLARWRAGAALLGLSPPPAAELMRPLIAAAVARSGVQLGALRLNWSRGSAADPHQRGLGLPGPGAPPLQPRFWLQLTPRTPLFTPQSAWISRSERRDPRSLLSRIKGFSYAAAVQARREANLAGADEGLLLAVDGQLSCASAANLLVHHQGRWLTPPLTSGCLPGIRRQLALESGLAVERSITPEQLRTWAGEGDASCLLINSLGCRPIHRLEKCPLTPPGGQGTWEDPDIKAAEKLWRRLALNTFSPKSEAH